MSHETEIGEHLKRIRGETLSGRVFDSLTDVKPVTPAPRPPNWRGRQDEFFRDLFKVK